MGRGRSGLSKEENYTIDVSDPNNADFPGVREINSALNTVFNDYPELQNLLNAGVEINTEDFQNDPNSMGKFVTNGVYSGIAVNYAFASDPSKINAAMKDCADSDFHPQLGNASGYEAVMYHELGHAMTILAIGKQGKSVATSSDLERESSEILRNAYLKSDVKGSLPSFHKSISGYAFENATEGIAEAVCDYYCNRSKAKPASKAVFNHLNSLLKG